MKTNDEEGVLGFVDRMRALLKGLTGRQMATLARIVALILLAIAIYNAVKVISAFMS